MSRRKSTGSNQNGELKPSFDDFKSQLAANVSRRVRVAGAASLTVLALSAGGFEVHTYLFAQPEDNTVSASATQMDHGKPLVSEKPVSHESSQPIRLADTPESMQVLSGKLNKLGDLCDSGDTDRVVVVNPNADGTKYVAQQVVNRPDATVYVGGAAQLGELVVCGAETNIEIAGTVQNMYVVGALAHLTVSGQVENSFLVGAHLDIEVTGQLNNTFITGNYGARLDGAGEMRNVYLNY